MEAGAVSRQLCSLWIKIGILTKNDKNMSCNILRKSAREAEEIRELKKFLIVLKQQRRNM